MSLDARWGNSCGIPFNAHKFCEKNKQWKDYEPYLLDRPTQKWTVFSPNNKHNRTMKKRDNIV
jgi:hypothetical protein